MDLDTTTLITLAVIAAVVVIVLAWRFDLLNIKVKKGDLEVSIDGERSSESPSAPPAAANQTNVGSDQNIAHGDITHVERDVVHGDNVGRDKVDMSNAGGNVALFEESQSHHSVVYQITNNNYYFSPREENVRSNRAEGEDESERIVEFTLRSSNEDDAAKIEGNLSFMNLEAFATIIQEFQRVEHKVRSGALGEYEALVSMHTALAKVIAEWKG